MNEEIRDIERLKHILEQIDALIAIASESTIGSLDEDKVRYKSSKE